MIHDTWFTIVLLFMFCVAMILRLLSIIIGLSNTYSQSVIKDMLKVNVLSRERQETK